MGKNDVKIDIETLAKGTGAKDTAAGLDELKVGSEKAGASAKQLRKELDKTDNATEEVRKEVEKFADSLEDIAKKGAKAVDRITAIGAAEDKVGIKSRDLGAGIYEVGRAADETTGEVDGLRNAQDQLGDETDDATRSLEKLDKELLVAQKALKKTAIGTSQFTTAQARVTSLEKERTSAIKKGGAANRNMGLATLEASRAFEDMQYGIRGALNNLPGLIQMLGGTAGMAGVLSVVAVSLSVVIPLLKDEAEAIELVGKKAEYASDQKIKYARLEREIAREVKADSEEYINQLDEEIDAFGKKVKAIDEATAARGREYALAQAVKDAQLSKAITVISADNRLTEVQKVSAIEAIKNQADEVAREKRIQSLEEEKEAEKKKLAIAIEAAEAEEEKTRELERQLVLQEKLIRTAEGGSKRYDSLKSQREKAVKGFDKSINRQALTNSILGAGEVVTAPDLEDFDSDKSFLTAAQKTITDNGGFKRTSAQADIDNVLKIIKEEEKTRAELARMKGAVVLNKEKVKGLEATIRKLKSEGRGADGAEKKIEILDNQIEAEEVIQDSDRTRQSINSQQATAAAAAKDVGREQQELISSMIEEMLSEGSNKEFQQQAVAAQKLVNEEWKKANEDGVITNEEMLKVSTATRQVLEKFKLNTSAVLKNMNELIGAQETTQRTLTNMQSQIDRISSNVGG